jgi:predicted enzyme related to lactoylglutathione lyase
MTESTFAFTKLVVSDLASSERFYGHAFALEETMLTSIGEPEGSNIPILMRYLNRPCPQPGAAWVGFTVKDLEEIMEAAVRFGGKTAVAAHENEEHEVRAARLEDNEGDLIEIVQLRSSEKSTALAVRASLRGRPCSGPPSGPRRLHVLSFPTSQVLRLTFGADDPGRPWTGDELV